MKKIVWDEPKRQETLAKRGLDFADAVDFEWETALIGPANPGKDGRARLKAIGVLHNGVIVVIFALLGTEALSIISMRPASPKERKLYESR